MLKLKDVSKIYNPNTSYACTALSRVNLEIKQGDSIAIMGVSGSGKSTLLNILSTIDNPTDGQYLLFGKDIKDYSNAEICKIRNENIGFVLQDYGLLQGDSVYDNVVMPLLLGNKYPKNQIKERVFEVLEQLDIDELSKKKVNKLSGGQKQRVAIARAIVSDPDIIFADEPTGALDSKTSIEVMNIFQNLNKCRKTLIMVTHDIKMAQYMNKIINISDGEIFD